MDRKVARLGLAAVCGAVIAGAVTSPPLAEAMVAQRAVEVYVGWDGAQCVGLGEPDVHRGRRSLVATLACDPKQSGGSVYQSHPGEFFGVRMASNDARVGLACKVIVSGRTVIERKGYGSLDCMDRWSA